MAMPAKTKFARMTRMKTTIMVSPFFEMARRLHEKVFYGFRLEISTSIFC
jgi:hypothetical protein